VYCCGVSCTLTSYKQSSRFRLLVPLLISDNVRRLSSVLISRSSHWPPDQSLVVHGAVVVSFFRQQRPNDRGQLSSRGNDRLSRPFPRLGRRQAPAENRPNGFVPSHAIPSGSQGVPLPSEESPQRLYLSAPHQSEAGFLVGERTENGHAKPRGSCCRIGRADFP
jgi:hypothetical protein